MKLVTWNVNGIRAAWKAGMPTAIQELGADAVCLQETKAEESQLDLFLRNPPGFYSLWHSAEKAGYSGVAVYLRRGLEPLEVRSGMGIPQIDAEGRVLQIRFPRFTLINAYFPNSQREHARLPYKLAFCEAMRQHCDRLRAAGQTVLLCGDFNIAHREIDLRNPRENRNNAGFLPQERAWMDQFEAGGYVDSFRRFCPEPEQYTWWSYRPGVRERNIGWRLDYFWVNGESADSLAVARHHPEIRGSDHCPVFLQTRD